MTNQTRIFQGVGLTLRDGVQVAAVIQLLCLCLQTPLAPWVDVLA